MTAQTKTVASGEDIYGAFGLYLDGAWQRNQNLRWMGVINPATEMVIGTIPCAGTDELDHALESAREGLSLWRRTHPWDRAAVLKATANWLRREIDRCAHIMSLEQGKPLAEAAREFGMAADHFEWAAEEAKRITHQIVPARPAGTSSTICHEPVGVVAAFTPWNFPALQVAAKISYALAAGCSVILKPSEETPGSAAQIVQALHESGLPGGVLSVVFGDPAPISSHLIASSIVRSVSFTGSTAVGKILMAQAAPTLKHLTLELGGHAPVLVYPDADPKQAAELAGAIKFRNAGQACVSPSRFFVHEDIAEAFALHMVSYAEKLVLGAGTDPATTMGPMANKRRVDAARTLVDDAVRKGAILRTGGTPPSDRNVGFYFKPTVLSGVSEDSLIMQEEPFAPIAAIRSFSDNDDIVEWANALPYGLAAYIFTENPDRATAVAEQLEVGMVGVNNFALASAETPFGGVKQSGFGREGGPGAIQEYLVPKLVKRRQ